MNVYYSVTIILWTFQTVILKAKGSKYINYKSSNLLNLILFVDDTNVFVSHKDLNYLSDMLNLEMDKLSIWFKANKLSLNLKKKKMFGL